MYEPFNMATITDPKIPKIIYSRTSKKVMEGEIFIKQHVFDYIISGTSEVIFDGKTYQFSAGDFRFAVRNRLSKFIKSPTEGQEYRSISICIDHDSLLELKKQYIISEVKVQQEDFKNVFLLKKNKLFKNYIDSLLPYLENGNEINEQLIRLKIKEAVMIFIEANPNLIDILFNFNEPGKIDLEGYMNEHYLYSGELVEFAYLTGRSLSTFKRDFQKIFKTTPNKWLVQKRLNEAYYLIKDKGFSPSDACLDTGFKNYSHFSISFKKTFGMAPSFA